MKKEILKFLNKKVNVCIDRELGSRHPKWKYIYHCFFPCITIYRNQYS